MVFTEQELQHLESAVVMIRNGLCSGVEISKHIKVYQVKGVIRIDLKEEKK